MASNRALLGTLLLAASLPSAAALFDDDEARRRIEVLRAEVSQIARDVDARSQRLDEAIRRIGVVELVGQIDQLNAEIAKLRGQLEVLSNENQQIQKRQRDFYLDLDSRLKRLEGGGASAPSASAPPAADPGPTAPGQVAMAAPAAPPKPPSKEEQAREVRAYDAASNLFRRNDFNSAIEAFRAFLKDFPGSQLAPNAQYWIGICYANLKDYRNAVAAQEELLSKYPQSPKAPDAMLAIASAQSERGDNGSARNTLEDIIARYPSSEAAGKARTRLASLKR